MRTLNIPLFAPLTKTLTRRQITMSRDTIGNPQKVTTTYAILAKIMADVSLTNAEHTEAISVIDTVGAEPVLIKDPTDFEATAERKYDGYGAWTQGLYIPSYNRYSGTFVKAYGVTSEFIPAYDSIYLRPIASLTSTGLVYFNNTLATPMTYDADTQTANPYHGTQVTNDFLNMVATSGATRPTLGADAKRTKVSYPASFTFNQAYQVIKCEEKTENYSRQLIGDCGADRNLAVEFHEVLVNHVSPYISAYRNEALA